MEDFDIPIDDFEVKEEKHEDQDKLYHLIDDLLEYCRYHQLLLFNHYNMVGIMENWINKP